MPEEQSRTLTDKFMLRLPDGLRDRIKAAAEANNRSMNSEILAVLEEKYPPRMEALEIFRALVPAVDAMPPDLQGEVIQHLDRIFELIDQSKAKTSSRR